MGYRTPFQDTKQTQMGDTPTWKETHLGDIVTHMNAKQTTSRTIGAVIKQLLKIQHITQESASTETGIPITSLNRKLNSGVFNIEELSSMANVLNLKLSSIIKLGEWVEDGNKLEEYPGVLDVEKVA